MPGILNPLFKVLAFALAFALIIRLWLVVLRVEYAESILARTPEQRKRLLDSYRKLIRHLQLTLFLYPVVVASFLAAHWLTPGLDGPVLLIAGLELGLMLAAEYRFQKWLVRYVTDHEEQPATSPG